MHIFLEPFHQHKESISSFTTFADETLPQHTNYSKKDLSPYSSPNAHNLLSISWYSL